MVLGIILAAIGGITLLYYIIALFGPGYGINVTIIPLPVHLVFMAIALALLIVGILLVRKKVSKTITTAKNGKKYLPFSYFKSNIVSGCIGAVILIILLLVWFPVAAWITESVQVRDFSIYFNIWGIIAFAIFFIVAGSAISAHDFSNPAFGKYHPSHKKISATRAFVKSVYEEKGLTGSIRRVILIFAIIYAAIIGVAAFFDLFALSALVAVVALFVPASSIGCSDDDIDNFIAEKSNCKNWQDYVCKYCDTLISNSCLVSSKTTEGDSSLWRDTTTTTTTTTSTTTDYTLIGNTEYIDTYVDTKVDTDVRVRDYIRTEYSETHEYRCPSCKRPHYIFRTYNIQRDL